VLEYRGGSHSTQAPRPDRYRQRRRQPGCLFFHLSRMTTPRTVKKHGGVQKVRMKRLSDGTLVRIYFYKDHKSFVEARNERINGGTKRKRKEDA
jgi:hypothetical protein